MGGSRGDGPARPRRPRRRPRRRASCERPREPRRLRAGSRAPRTAISSLSMGQMVEFPSNGATGRGYLASPSVGAGLGLIVIQEWWGLVPHIKDVCDRFAAEGFTALAP